MSNISGDKLRLYAVTDRGCLNGRDLIEQVERALAGGVSCVQLRDKRASDDEMTAQARLLLPVCYRYGAPLIINDRVQVAAAARADGVHLGLKDAAIAQARRALGAYAILGASAHNEQEALLAQAQGADYLGSGAVFGTGTKPDASALDHAELGRICAAVRIPVVAIGGVAQDTLMRLAGWGLSGVAVVSALFAQGDVQAAARQLRAMSDQMVGCPPNGRQGGGMR